MEWSNDLLYGDVSTMLCCIRSEHLPASTLPVEARIATSTFNFHERAASFTNDTVIVLSKMVYLKPTEGLVLTWAPDADKMNQNKN
jgi:hypothetical protein